MINDEIKAIFARESSAALATAGPDGPHLVATWNSYIEVVSDTAIAFPAGGMRQTQANAEAGSPVQMIIGSRDDTGKGRGFRLTGRAEFQTGTALHERMKQRFPWCRTAMLLHIERVEKVLG